MTDVTTRRRRDVLEWGDRRHDITPDSDDRAASASHPHRTATITAVIAIAPLCVVGVLLTETSWADVLVIATGYLLTLGILRDWNLERYPWTAHLALAFTGSMWVMSAVFDNSPIGFMPFALVGALLLARSRRRRALWMVTFAASVALLGATSLILHPPGWSVIGLYVLLPFAGTLLIAGVILVSERAWILVRRSERAREADEELAIARERARFAGDLHDIQGHSLHVVKLKAALAQHLIRGDPDRAVAELVEIRKLIDETIAKTGELAYAQHRLNLSAELENAKQVCEAAGISVRVTQDVDPRLVPHPLLAHVLREGTTNLLRHARPDHVSIDVTANRVHMVNDGSLADEPVELRGLARLRTRVEAAGGSLAVAWSGEQFSVVAEIEPSGRSGTPVASNHRGHGV